jgi:glycerophosphoryl diester phosphodiesterase
MLSRMLGRLVPLLLIACSATPLPAPLEAPIALPRIVAHRGASEEAPENTLRAFRRAWELGVECVELDVHVTKDGHVVVMHDETTKRIGGRDRKIADQTLAELRELDVGSWKSPAFRGERIPTLGDVLATVPKGRTLFVEIKSGPETIPAIAAAIERKDPRPRGGKLALQGFDAKTLAAFAAAVPDAPAYWTVDPPVDDTDKEHPIPLPYPRGVVAEAKRHGFPGLALFFGSVTDELLADAEAAGLEIDVWTINEAPELARWTSRKGIRWIETDRPDLVSR